MNSRTTRVLTGLLAAVLVGVPAGVTARLLMRLLMTLDGGAPGFSLAGSAMIVIFFTAVMIPGGVAAGLGSRRAATVLLTLGAAFLVLQSVNIGLQEDLVALSRHGTGTLVAILAALVAFPVVIVAQAVLTWRAAGRLTRRDARSLAPVAPSAL